VFPSHDRRPRTGALTHSAASPRPPQSHSAHQVPWSPEPAAGSFHSFSACQPRPAPPGAQGWYPTELAEPALLRAAMLCRSTYSATWRGDRWRADALALRRLGTSPGARPRAASTGTRGPWGYCRWSRLGTSHSRQGLSGGGGGGGGLGLGGGDSRVVCGWHSASAGWVLKQQSPAEEAQQGEKGGQYCVLAPPDWERARWYAAELPQGYPRPRREMHRKGVFKGMHPGVIKDFPYMTSTLCCAQMGLNWAHLTHIDRGVKRAVVAVTHPLSVRCGLALGSAGRERRTRAATRSWHRKAMAEGRTPPQALFFQERVHQGTPAVCTPRRWLAGPRPPAGANEGSPGLRGSTPVLCAVC